LAQRGAASEAQRVLSEALAAFAGQPATPELAEVREHLRGMAIDR
jgi:hypothetical protein